MSIAFFATPLCRPSYPQAATGTKIYTALLFHEIVTQLVGGCAMFKLDKVLHDLIKGNHHEHI